MEKLSPAIFLDRDGTLHRDKEYLIKFEDVEFIPGVEEALLLLQSKGYRLFVASNQSGVARGFFTLDDVLALNRKMREYFLNKGIDIEDWAICPHLPEGTVAPYARECDCRKPLPGLLLDLAKRHGLDLSRSYMVGDKLRDAQAGIAAGATGVLISPNSKGSFDAEMRLQEFPSMLDFARVLQELMRLMPVNKDIEPGLDITDDNELKTLQEEWATGKLKTLSGHLLEFIDRNRADILKIAKTSRSHEKLVDAAKKFVRRRGFIHLPLDMADQIHEITNEIWYHGEKGVFDRRKIQEAWTVEHAPSWRRWRIKQILYIIDQRAYEVSAELLK